TLRHHLRDAGAAALDVGVQAGGGAMDDQFDIGIGDAGLLDDFDDATLDCGRGVRIFARLLEEDRLAGGGVDQNEVGEGSPDIYADAALRFHDAVPAVNGGARPVIRPGAT